MSCCPHCEDAEDFFGDKIARRDLRGYVKKGPSRPTRLLLDAIRPRLSGDATLMDIGGGVGVIQHELLGSGVERTLHVDVSRPYLRASEEEAARRGHAGRTDYRFGDFVDLAPDLPDAHLVTLDRVICCYPDMERLVTASAAKATRLYGVVYPRARWAARAVVEAGNLYFRIRGSNFRSFLHSPRAIVATVEGCGFTAVARNRTFIWEVNVFERVDKT